MNKYDDKELLRHGNDQKYELLAPQSAMDPSQILYTSDPLLLSSNRLSVYVESIGGLDPPSFSGNSSTSISS